MEITLIRTGGMIPMLKKAKKEVDWSEKELDELINMIKTDNKPGKMRDNTQYELMYNDQAYSINLEKIPAKFKKTFETLKDDLQIVKPG